MPETPVLPSPQPLVMLLASFPLNPGIREIA